MPPRRELFRNLLLSLSSVAALLLVLELGVRLCAPVPLVATDLFLVSEPRTAELEARTARRALKPGVECRHVTAEYDVAVHINGKGLRDPERSYDQSPNTTRVLVLGDSFTFGYGVEEPERFTNRLETRLNGTGPRRYEIINAGAPSWGTADELLYLQEEGLKYHPESVLVCFYQNDVHDNLERHLFFLQDGQLMARPRLPTKAQVSGEYITRDPLNEQILDVTVDRLPEPRAPQVPFLVAHSHLARLARLAWFRAKTRSSPAQNPAEERQKYAQELTGQLFAEMQRVSEQAGASFGIMLIPDKTDFANGKTHSLHRFPLLFAWATRQPRGRVLDLLSRLRSTPQPQALYYKKDAHLNARGHAMVAEFMEPFLRNLTEERSPQP